MKPKAPHIWIVKVPTMNGTRYDLYHRYDNGRKMVYQRTLGRDK